MKVGVVGAGTMGSGITQVMAFCKNEVRLVDREEKFLDRGIAIIERSLQKIISKKPEAEQTGLF